MNICNALSSFLAKFDLFYKNYTWRKFFVTLWRGLSLTAVKSAMILKLTIVDLNNRYVFQTTFTKFEDTATISDVFRSKNVKEEEVIEVKVG